MILLLVVVALKRKAFKGLNNYRTPPLHVLSLILVNHRSFTLW